MRNGCVLPFKTRHSVLGIFASTPDPRTTREIEMKRLLGLAAVIEAATGVALMIHPPLLSRLVAGRRRFRRGNSAGSHSRVRAPLFRIGLLAGYQASRQKHAGSSSAAPVQPAGNALPRLPRDPWPTRWELVVARRRAPRRALAASRPCVANLCRSGASESNESRGRRENRSRVMNVKVRGIFRGHPIFKWFRILIFGFQADPAEAERRGRETPPAKDTGG